MDMKARFNVYCKKCGVLLWWREVESGGDYVTMILDDEQFLQSFEWHKDKCKK